MWRDTFFCWNKEDYGDLDSIRVPNSYVWRPDIILYNSVDQFSSPAETNVVVRYDGLVTWDSPAIVRTTCQLDVTFFPFDGQRCPLTFGSWTYSGHQVSVWPGSNGGQLADLVEDVEWEVLGMPAHRRLVQYGCCAEPYTEVTFTLVLKRRTAFYLYNLLLPCILISGLAPLVFYLPPPSGEKVSLGITLLLGLSIFQLMVADIMPPADSAPLIGKYYMAMMTMMTISTAMTILTMSIHYCGPEARPVPYWVKVVILGHLARALSVHELGESCRRGMESGDQVNDGQQVLEEVEEQHPGEEGGAEGVSGLSDLPRATTNHSPDRKGYPGSCPHHWPQLAREVEFIASCMGRQRETQQRVWEWRTVNRVVDRLFTWIFMLMVLAMSVVIAAQAL
ncbi:neuronal acetylcholine receptor subunit alpha-9-like [Narcine bancroftii]|uniref:neuronal acetylcholine receptor subunit alpha-9-like n=1 Tax=Narcine bancroftii TaxID=1343680 RepID=UPI003831DE32